MPEDLLEKVQTNSSVTSIPFRFRRARRGRRRRSRNSLQAQGLRSPHYMFLLRPREIENTQFPWTFQRQLYDCLHDYVIEMFTRNPQRMN